MKIYIIENEETRRVPEELCRQLFPRRMQRADRYRRSEDRLMSVGAGLLTEFVAGVAEDDIILTEYGKPISRSGVYFSVSHSDGCAVLAVGKADVGVDVERISKSNLSLAKTVYTENELLWMSADPLPRFHILWSIKESIMKASGLGLSLEPQSFEVVPDRGEAVARGRRYYFSYTVSGGRSFAAASVDGVGEIELVRVVYDGIRLDPTKIC